MDGRTWFITLFWMFTGASVLGFVGEGLWHMLLFGSWERHSCTVYGPFCVIYGFAMVFAYLLSFLLRGKNILLQFVVCTVAGTAWEFIASYFQSALFGSTSWNYDHMFMNIDGRVSLGMSIMWGVIGTVAVRYVCPRIGQWAMKLTVGANLGVTAVLCVLLCIDLLLSMAALWRWNTRRIDPVPSNVIEQRLDEKFPDARMAALFPNWKFEHTAARA